VTATHGVSLRLDGDEARLATSFVRWLETGRRPDDLFSTDAFADLSLPQWRLQGDGPVAIFDLRASSHPFRGEVTVTGLDTTARGFLVEFEERWDADGQRWYCRELIHCIVDGDRISELRVYCTGDWDEVVQRAHAEQVHLTRP
jgi:hypothetical protein